MTYVREPDTGCGTVWYQGLRMGVHYDLLKTKGPLRSNEYKGRESYTIREKEVKERREVGRV